MPSVGHTGDSKDIDTKEWVSWLETIQEDPRDHKLIIKRDQKYHFVNKQEKRFSETTLSSNKILKISERVLHTSDLVDKYKILRGMKHIISKREEKFNNLNIVSKIFARWRGIETAIQKENKDLTKLIEDNFAPASLIEDNLAILRLKDKELINAYVATLSPEEKEKYEKTLTRDCNLAGRDPSEIERRYVERMLQRAIIAKSTVFAPSIVVQIENLWDGIEQHRSEGKEQEAQERIFGNHRVIFLPSKKIGNTVEKGAIYPIGDKLGQGAFRAAWSAMPILGAVREETVILRPIKQAPIQIEQDVSLSVGSHSAGGTSGGLGTVAQTSKEPNTPEFAGRILALKEPVEGVPIKYESFKTTGSRATTQVDAQTRQTYKNQREGEFWSQLKNDEGMWKIHQVVRKTDGETVIFQRAAGYKVTPRIINRGTTAFLKSNANFLAELEKKKLYKDGQIRVIDLHLFFELARRGLLMPEDQGVLLHMIGDCLKGVRSMHRRGIIHRDLKPANILCAPNGTAGVADLGEACKNDSPDRRECAGTLNHMPPEVARSNPDIPQFKKDRNHWEEISIQVDGWSVGMILWAILSGKSINEHPAFNSKGSTMELFQQIGELCTSSKLATRNDRAVEAYNQRTVEPEKNRLLHLMWQYTRADPEKRPTDNEAIEQYETWEKLAQKKLKKGEDLYGPTGKFNHSFLAIKSR